VPSARPSAPYANDCLRAPWSWSVKRVATTAPAASFTIAVTDARAARVYETVNASSIPSPSGEITGGVAVNAPSSVAAGGGGGGAFPIVPEAGRVCAPASIAHVYERLAGIPVASQVQATVEPVPRPRATAVPAAFRT